MSTYTMLGDYTCEKENSTQFRILFNIPDNCFYDLNFATGKYTIQIQLNPKETQPSTTFIQECEIVNMVSNGLDLRFDQIDSSGSSIKKPSVIINE